MVAGTGSSEGSGPAGTDARPPRIPVDAGGRKPRSPPRSVGQPLLLPRLCAAVGLHPETEVDLFALLTETLRDEAVLLVVDNFEQVAPAGGEIGRLVAALPHLRVLVTSRDRLRLSVERTIEIMPLDTGGRAGTDSPASILFEQFARRADPEFRLTEANNSTVRSICELVDGLPLALGLAAAQLGYLPLDYLVNPPPSQHRIDRRAPRRPSGAPTLRHPSRHRRPCVGATGRRRPAARRPTGITSRSWSA